ncbi:MAG: hypothetical protein JW781_07345 [Deltaproteobacteria bacterium]|nr:hypothetical protein [Candidatus Anaeroferrophillacea bacterium]
MSAPIRQYHYPSPPAAYPPAARSQTSYTAPSAVLNTGMFGMVVGTTVALGANLHRVGDDGMTMGEAFTDSLVKGAGAGVATAAAVAAARAAGGSGFVNLVVLLGTATGVGYLLHTVGRQAAAKTTASAVVDAAAEKTERTKTEKK